MAAAAGPRRLSDLPDDALRRILFFAPAREGATTAVLSRRWRWLWRTCGAVNLDTRSFKLQEDEPGIQVHPEDDEPWTQPEDQSYGSEFSTKEREIFLHAAGEALAAVAAAPLTRLSVVVAANSRINTTYLEDWSEHDLIGAVVNNPAARRVEELHVEVEDLNTCFSLSFGGSLPSSKTLRVARFIRCKPLTAAPPDAAAFPRLAELHLERCTVTVVHLQRIVDAAPQLKTLHLDDCHMPKEEEEQYHHGPAPEAECCRLVFPEVTTLVFARCNYQRWDRVRLLEIDAPKLRYFRYQGSVQHSDGLCLKPHTNLAQVYLDFTDDPRAGYSYKDRGQEVHELFWQFIRNFSTVKVLKIQLHFTTDRVTVKGNMVELLGGLSFSYLERLELRLSNRESTTVMLANLLRDLQLKLRKCYSGKSFSIDKEMQADFNKSVDRFRKRRSPMVSLGDRFRKRKSPMVSLGEEDVDNHEAPYIRGLSDESFDCLQSYLRRVSLHFCMEEPSNCLGVQLAKFFTENAMVLEEMYVDDGSHKMREHMNNSVGRSLANQSAKRRKFGGIAILPR